jgi:hypothetical protein
VAGISQKPLFWGFLAVLLALQATVNGADGSENLQNGKILQPLGLDRTGIYALRLIDPALTGLGVKFAVICRSYTYIDDKQQNDYRPAISHNCFKNKQFNFYDQALLPSGISPHSTAVCSILFGEDPNAFNPQIGQFYYQGASPEAQVDIYEFNYFVFNNLSSYTPPAVDIITADFGYPFEEWWTKGIESLVEHSGILVIAGIGNGTDAFDSVLYPAAGANTIGVGLVDSVNSDNPEINLKNFALAYPAHSSSGPTGDGRCKPDIIAPGNCLAADVNAPDQYEPTGNWSSFSTPIVAGAIGMLVQKAKQEPDLGMAVSAQGGNCVIKAIVMNSAIKLPYWHKGRLSANDDHFTPLDYIQGAGMLNAVGAYHTLTAGIQKPGKVSITGWDLNRLDQDNTRENVYRFTVAEPNDKYITTTAVWNKHYQDAYPFEPLPEKDMNLRLELWAVDPNIPENSYMLDYSDSMIDNVEHIYAPADPNYTNYEIIISISNVDNAIPASLSQLYGLAWNTSAEQNSDSILWYDLNADGIVNESDLKVMLTNLLDSVKAPEKYILGDINPNGAIDANDLKVLMEHSNLRADWRQNQ